MVTNPVAANLTELKVALQELESAVQRPTDAMGSVEDINNHFPQVFAKLLAILETLLVKYEDSADSPRDVIHKAHSRGWLKGDLSLWLHMVADYTCIEENSCSGATAVSVCQDVRACTCILWQTYELLTAKFRWQTQVRTS